MVDFQRKYNVGYKTFFLLILLALQTNVFAAFGVYPIDTDLIYKTIHQDEVTTISNPAKVSPKATTVKKVASTPIPKESNATIPATALETAPKIISQKSSPKVQENWIGIVRKNPNITTPAIKEDTP